MYRKAKLCLVGLLAVVFITVSFLPPSPGDRFIWDPHTQPSFAIAASTYTDEYGQGIDKFEVYENSTGGWEYYPPYEHYPTDPNIFNLTGGYSVKIYIWTYLNHTLTGATSKTNGRNFLRHNVTVRSVSGDTVFSKNNFTYSDSYTVGATLYYYEYSVLLNFLAAFGEYYRVSITYEVYYLGDWISTDPAWLTGYNCRQSHVITASAGAGTDYQVSLNVTRTGGTSSGAICYVGTNCQSDFDDVRFTDNDGTTLLDYYREGYTSTTAKFWIEVKDNLNSTSATIYVYYGNSSVSTTSNGPYTFWFFDDFETGAFGRWDFAGSYWSVVDTSSFVKHGTYAAYADAGATAAYRFLNVSRPTVAYGVMLHMWVRFAVAASAFLYGGFAKSGTNHYSYNSAYDTSPAGFATYNGVAWQSYCKFPAINTWYETNCGWDRSNSSYEFYMDGSKGAERAATWVDTTPFNGFTHLFSWAAQAAGWDHWLDDVWIRKWVPSEPAHSTWGAQEDARTWNQAGDTAVLYFLTPIDTFSLHSLYILIGLIMIPASTLYLVANGTDSIDSKKIFVFFILFLFGWALFLGVINP